LGLRWVFVAELAVVALESGAFLVVGYLLCRRHRWLRYPAMVAGAACLGYRILTSLFPDRFYIGSPYLILTGLITPAGFLLLAAALTLAIRKSRQRVLVGVFSVVLTYYVFCDAAYLVVKGPELAHAEGTWEGETMRQSRPFTCGPAAAAALLRAWGVTLPEGVIACAARTTFRGTEPPRLADAVRAFGLFKPLKVRIISTGLAELRAMDRPAILFVTKGGRRHVVTLLHLAEDGIRIADPGAGTRELDVRAFEREYRWTGRAVVAWRDPAFDRRSDEPPDPTLSGGE
jgi:predicted double-glycine peptidase